MEEEKVRVVFESWHKGLIEWTGEVEKRWEDSNRSRGAWSIKERLKWREWKKRDKEFRDMVDRYYEGR